MLNRRHANASPCLTSTVVILYFNMARHFDIIIFLNSMRIFGICSSFIALFCSGLRSLSYAVLKVESVNVVRKIWFIVVRHLLFSRLFWIGFRRISSSIFPPALINYAVMKSCWGALLLFSFFMPFLIFCWGEAVWIGT